MARYIASEDLLLSHECRIVKAGEEFETTFPKGMVLGDNVQLVKASAKTKPVPTETDPLEGDEKT
ncbi:hypothetical protein [Methylomonas sp. AM2-LC]|uniref:hypothetical protein n=1 Tax=Methylomonas sp. AM2-LC TaxID=3153301 RepID=UPI003265696F